MVNVYRKVSINNLKLTASRVPIRERVSLRIVPEKKSWPAEIRFWYKDKLVGIQKLRNEDLDTQIFSIYIQSTFIF